MPFSACLFHHSPKNQARSCGRCLGTPSCCGGVGVAQPVAACRGLAEVVVGNPPTKMAPKVTIFWFLLLLQSSFFFFSVWPFGHVLLQLLLFQKYFIMDYGFGVFLADWQMNESNLFLWNWFQLALVGSLWSYYDLVGKHVSLLYI